MERNGVLPQSLTPPDPRELPLPDPLPDQFFDLMLSEKNHADSQIRSNLEANLKILGVVVTALVAGLGWLLSAGQDASRSHHVAAILLVLVVFASFGMLLGAIFNGFAFGYMNYKTFFLGRCFQKALGLKFNPLVTSAFIGRTTARWSIFVGTTASGAGQMLLAWSLFSWAVFLSLGTHGAQGTSGKYETVVIGPASAASAGGSLRTRPNPANVGWPAFLVVGVVLVAASGANALTVRAMFDTRKRADEELMRVEGVA